MPTTGSLPFRLFILAVGALSWIYCIYIYNIQGEERKALACLQYDKLSVSNYNHDNTVSVHYHLAAIVTQIY